MANSERYLQSQIIYDTVSIRKGTGNASSDDPSDTIDLLASNAIEKLTIFEDMFAPCLSGKLQVKDFSDFGAILPLKGNEILDIFIKEPDSEEGVVYLPPFHIYSVEQIDGDMNSMRAYEIYFTARDLTMSTYDDAHLYEDIKESNPELAEYNGYIHDFVKDLLSKNYQFDMQNYEFPLSERVEETTNKIWYRPKEEEYSSLRKDGPQKFLDLMHQLAENAYYEDEGEGGGVKANYMFYQDLEKWNFKSVHSMIEEAGEEVPEEKSYFFNMDMSGETGKLIRNRILNISRAKRADHIDLLESGAYRTNFVYYRPKIDTEKYPFWFTSNLKKFYYRVNCRYRDHFPAAIVGFEQIDDYVPRWRYAFAEVYLVFDYENNKPSFKIKPINHGGTRSWVTYEESGPHWIIGEEEGEDYKYFGRSAFNTMEMGNDGFYDYEGEETGRLGWESPGVRIDSMLWEDGCFKIQPIRGSMTEVQSEEEDGETIPGEHQSGPDGEKNNVKRLISPLIDDDQDVTGIYPVVDMKIYWDQENNPQYFFTASNTVDGECDQEDDDCKDLPTEEQ